jgi:hypothetical protein
MAMRTDLLRTTAIALLLIGGMGFSAAQTQTVEPKKNDDAMKTESGKAGKTEPSSHSPSAPPENAALWNGAPAVPGAKAEGDMVPAKFSAKNDADDKLPTWGYTFKHLSAAQKRAIYETVKKVGAAAPDAIETLGAEVPRTIDLSVLPSDVTAQIPETKSYRYVTTQTKVLLVNPLNRVVVEVLAE